MTFEQLIDELSCTRKVILSSKDVSFTGVELVAAIFETATELKSLGFAERKIVILRMANNIDSIITFMALILCDCAVFVANPRDPIQKACNSIENFSSFALLSDKPSAFAVNRRYENDESIIKYDENVVKYDLTSVTMSANIFSKNTHPIGAYDHRMKEANVAIFSSGSTGEPKAILHNIENLLKNASMHVEAVGLKSSDTMGITLPLYYSYGLVANLLGSLIAKARISLHYQTSAVDCEWINREQVSFLGLTPYFASTLQQPLPSLRVVTLGGDILYRKNALQLMNDFPHCQFFSTYGLTEAGPRVATWKFDREVLNDCTIVPLGQPLKDVQLSLRDEQNLESSSGELIVKTTTRMIGYFFGPVKGFEMPNWNDKEVFTDDLFELKDGNLYFFGRKKHIIVQGGEKLFPVVLESAIQKIDGVIEAKVGSIIDADKGQVAKAYIVADNSVSLASVNKALLAQFTRSLIPAQLEFVDSIARTLTGKMA